MTQSGQPFEYGEKLAGLVRRQQEITDSLDLVKNQASSWLESDSESALVEEDTASLREMGF